MPIPRTAVALEDQWNVAPLYPSFEKWQTEFKQLCPEGKRPRWPALAKFKGHLAEGAGQVKECLDQMFALSRGLSKLYTYAHLKHDEDIANDQYKVALGQITGYLHDMHEETAWFEPELLSLPDETLKGYLGSPLLSDYRFHLEKIVRMRPYTLSSEKEELLALAGKALQAPHRAFSAINDADFKFPSITDSQGQTRELSHALYGLYIRDRDRILRRHAFHALFGKYREYENSLCELLSGQIQGHLFNARSHGYNSCLKAALYPKNVDTEVYHALIKSVRDNISVLHKYTKLRKNLLGLDSLHFYDLYVPLVPHVDIKMNYKEAEDLVIESVAPLGAEYQNILMKGLKDERWVDRYENENKRSGAYSSGCYDSMPYILMNYKNILKDVFTLAHEAGHSMHSYLSHLNQPYQYADYPIFLAEVASTFNEELLSKLLLERTTDKAEKLYLINEKIEDIRGTLLRQTMFAEFELYLHNMAEEDAPLTPQRLKTAYRDLYTFYFGPELHIDHEVEIEWARIPHFYYNFYVFQYSTGISAALALAERVLNGGAAEREAYLGFLKSGSSRYPLDTLQLAGVDMRSSTPVEAALRKMNGLIDEFEKLAVVNV